MMRQHQFIYQNRARVKRYAPPSVVLKTFCFFKCLLSGEHVILLLHMFDGDAQGIDGKPFLREGLLILGANVALVIGGVVQVIGDIVGLDAHGAKLL